MPTYQYECDACEHAFEILQSMLDEKLKRCPQCHEEKLHRLIGAGSGFIFKGSGFYETDYKKKEPSHKKTVDSDKKESVEAVKSKEEKKSSSSGTKKTKNADQLVS